MGPILVFPRIQPFGSNDFSSLGKVYSRQATDSVNCENSSVSFVMKYCPTSTVAKKPASVHIFYNRSGCGSFSTRTLCLCNGFSCAWSSVKGVGVFIIELFRNKQWVILSYLNKSPCSYMTGFVFFTKIRDCSVNTGLINRTNCEKNSFTSFPHQRRSVLIIFHHLCFWAFLGTMDS